VLDGPVGAGPEPLNKVNIEGVAFWKRLQAFTGQFPIREPGDYKGPQDPHDAGGDPGAVQGLRARRHRLRRALQRAAAGRGRRPGEPDREHRIVRLFEVQKYLTLSDHGFLAYAFMFNKPMLDKLSKENRQILIDAAREGSRHQRDIIGQAEKENLETFKAGMQISMLTPEQRAKFEQASKPVYDWFTQKYGGASIDMIRKALAEQGKK
jgi:C4-dicarboxylate-binding protein DctP